jgi:hypothetical protein
MQAIRKCVFGSGAEKEHFGQLVERWGSRANVYHNLPFLQVFDLNQLDAIMSLDQVESSRLKKTSLDFVICDKADRPLVAIDFDGLNQGFNIGTSYLAGAGATPWRKAIFELKLRAAHLCQFPYAIVRSAQFRFLPGDARLTVIDGLIGAVLASIKTREDWHKVDLKKALPELEAMPAKQQSEAIQDLLLQVETAAQLENCPITARRWDLFKKLGINRYKFSPLDSGVASGIHARVWRGDVQADAKVWIPSFGLSGISDLEIVQNLGFLVAAEKLASKCRVNSTQDPAEGNAEKQETPAGGVSLLRNRQAGNEDPSIGKGLG